MKLVGRDLLVKTIITGCGLVLPARPSDPSTDQFVDQPVLSGRITDRFVAAELGEQASAVCLSMPQKCRPIGHNIHLSCDELDLVLVRAFQSILGELIWCCYLCFTAIQQSHAKRYFNSRHIAHKTRSPALILSQ